MGDPIRKSRLRKSTEQMNWFLQQINHKGEKKREGEPID